MNQQLKPCSPSGSMPCMHAWQRPGVVDKTLPLIRLPNSGEQSSTMIAFSKWR